MAPERPASSTPAARDARHRLLTQIASTFGVEVVGFFASLTFSVIATRALDREGKGVFASTLSAIAIGTAVANFGLSKSVIYYVNRPDGARGSVSAAVLAFLPVSVTLAIAFSFALLPHSVQNLGPTSLVAGALATLFIAIGFQESFLRSLKRIRSVNVSSLCQSLLQLPTVLGLLYVGWLDVTGALGVALLSAFVRFVLLTLALRQESELRPQPGQIKNTLRAMLSYGLTYQIYSLLWVCHIRLDVLMLERIGGADSAGLYATGANLAQLLWRLPNALMFVVLPYLASMKDDRGSIALAAKSARIAAPVLVLLALLGYALAHVLIPFLYGENFRASTTSFYILLPGVVLAALHLILSSSFVASGHLRLLVKNAAITLLVNLALNYFLLIPRYGDVGAALASAITYSLMFLLTVRDTCRITGSKPTVLLLLQREDWNKLREIVTR